MELVNTNGMAFIGPGSEWFCGAVSGLILAVTFIAIYRQLRLQRDAAAIQQLTDLEHEWSSERMARAKLTLLLALETGTNPDDLPNRAVSEIGFFWQRVGYVVRTGHVDRGLVYSHLGDQLQFWSTWLRPPWPDFAWLAQDAAALDAKRGVPSRADPASLAGEIPALIVHFREAIEMFESLRTVTVRLTPTPIPVTGAFPRSVPARTRSTHVRDR
ncbi:MAG TPA: hypothetical protein VKR30_01315 [Candidatus Limnocylindrales bacterium]|nr:hypothetical protein [Candidatus Limnocylindrales bacterium]